MNNENKWTRDIPTKVGYYWYRDEFGERIIQIISEDDKCYSSYDIGIVQLNSIPNFCKIGGWFYGAEWCGPLKSPK